MTEFDVCSDLHLEFDLDFYGYLDRQYIDQLFDNQSSDNLIIAGDLFAIPQRAHSERQLFDDIIGTIDDVVKSRYKNAYFVLGNHDYWYHYDCDCQEIVDFWTKKLPSFNVLDYTTNPIALIDDIVIFGSTGWTELKNDIDLSIVERSMNDYRYSNFTAGYTSANAAATRKAIDKAAKQYYDKQLLVVTHHAPLQQCQIVHKSVPQAYFNQWTNVIDDNPNITNWIYGHVHQRYRFQHNKCALISNARGYCNHESIADDFRVLKVVV